MAQAIQKVCRVCGIDVSTQKRTKDTQGNYYCQPCYTANQGVAAATTASIPAESAQPKAKPSRTVAAVKSTLRWIKLFTVTLVAICLIAAIGLIFAPTAEQEKRERFLKEHPEAAAPTAASAIPSIHIVDSQGQVTFSNWTAKGFNLVATMVSKGPAKVDEITYTTRRDGVVKHRGDVQVPGGYFKTGEPTEVTILCWEDPNGLDVTVEIGY